MTIVNTGNVGIGTTTPGFPLTFKDEVGDKISFWGQSGDHYGIGISTSLLQIHSSSSSNDIAFGYGTSSTFTELMRIKGIGNVGIGTTSPDAAAILDLESTNKGFLPPRMSNAEIYAITNPSEGLVAFNTGLHKPVYFDGSIWRKFDGTAMLVIGDSIYGGVVFYLNSSGGGLICAVSDQSTSVLWGCQGTEISGADGTAIGTGAQNTIDIEAGCTSTGTAADICTNLMLNGYSDWFLPSQDELYEMYLNKAAIETTAIAYGGTAFATSGYYWSSTEYSNTYAWTQSFNNDGLQFEMPKDFPNILMRAVRAF